MESLKIESTMKKPSNKFFFLSSKLRKIKLWTKEEDELLLITAGENDCKNWKDISKKIKGRTSIQCSGRYKRIRPGIVKGGWTQEEDNLLINLIKKYGKNWSLISTYIPSKNGKQIRDRYVNKLDKDLKKGKFTSEDDSKIFKLYQKYGRMWTKISRFFDGRTGDMIKNRFYSNIRKKINSLKNNKETNVKSIVKIEENQNKSSFFL